MCVCVFCFVLFFHLKKKKNKLKGGSDPCRSGSGRVCEEATEGKLRLGSFFQRGRGGREGGYSTFCPPTLTVGVGETSMGKVSPDIGAWGWYGSSWTRRRSLQKKKKEGGDMCQSGTSFPILIFFFLSLIDLDRIWAGWPFLPPAPQKYRCSSSYDQISIAQKDTCEVSFAIPGC